MASNQVSLAILVEVQKALQNMQTFQAEATKSTQAVADGFGSLKTIGEAALAFLAVDKIKSFFGESIKAAADNEATVNRLGQAMANTGEYSDQALQSFKDFADQMQATTKYDDDVILGQLAIAKGFGLTNDKAKELVGGAAQLATAMHEDLGTAVEQLEKTMSGSAGRLAQAFPALKGFTEEQLKGGAAIRFFADTMKGTAENEINTYEGAVAQSKNALGDFEKSLGSLVTSSPVAIARIKGMTGVWQELQKFVDENKEELQSWVNFGFKAVATAVPVGVELLVGFAKVFEALAEGAADSYESLIEFSKALVDTYNEAVSGAIGGTADLISGMVDFIEQVPGGSAALKAMGVDADALKGSADDLTDSLQLKGVSDSLGSAQKDAHQFAVDLQTNIQGVNKTLDSFQASVDAGAQKIFNADTAVAASGKKVFENRSKGTQQATFDEKAYAQAIKDSQKIFDELQQASTDDVGRISIAYKKQIDEIQRLEDLGVKKGGIAAQQAADLRLEAEQVLTTKIGDIRDKENQKFIDDAKKAAEQAKQDIQNIAANPITFIIKTKPDDGTSDSFAESLKALANDFGHDLAKATHGYLGQALSDVTADGMKKGISAGIGILGDALNGSSGAANLFSQAGGVFADAILPGIGGAVSGILTQLEAGPDATKAQVEAFVKAIPDIVHAIAEASPEIVNGLVDALINKGGIVKIGIALTEAMLGIPEMQQIGKDWGLDFGKSIDDFGTKVANDIDGSFAKFQWPTIESPAWLKDLNISTPTWLKDLFIPSPDWLKYLGIPTPGWLKDFDDSVNKLTTFGGLTSAGGGGGGGNSGSSVTKVILAGAAGAGAFLASGIDEVPPGYPNDNYMAGLTSGERVVTVQQNGQLSKFLDDYESGRTNAELLQAIQQLTHAMSQPQLAPLEVKIGSDTLAKAILKLNRTNARVTA